MMACIGEPISWLRLERFALGTADPVIATHVAACPACRQCLEDIRGDVVALPRLVVPAAPPRRMWPRWWIPAIAAAATAAVAVLLLVLIPRRPSPEPAVARATVKGIGEVTVGLVRERAGTIRFDVLSYAPGDRWKVVLGCPPPVDGTPMWVEVSVADGLTVDHPLAASRLLCGNHVVVPGAFTITGNRTNRICAQVRANPTSPDAGAGIACLVVVAESP
jgi:hypothetical protein